jgi:hypothetical protein
VRTRLDNWIDRFLQPPCRNSVSLPDSGHEINSKLLRISRLMVFFVLFRIRSGSRACPPGIWTTF